MAKKAQKNQVANAEAFLALPDSTPKPDYLPGFGKFKVQIMTSAERAEYESISDTAARRALLLQMCILTADQQPQPLFTLEQATQAMEKRSPIPEALVSIILNHNQFNSDPDSLGKT